MPFDFNDLKKTDPLQSFLDEIERAGLGRPNIQGTGEIERYDTPDCKKGEKAGWAVLYLDKDFAAGAFGSWRNGKGQSWASNNSSEARVKMKEGQDKAEKARVERNENARVVALIMWDRSPPAINHPYLKSKGVGAHGIRQSGDNLLIPMMDTSGIFHSLQEIFPDGRKRNFKGGAVKGFFHVISGKEPTYLCEGYATGATVHEATGCRVVITFSCGNLQEVAKSFPNAIVAADNDYQTQGNPGLTAAKETGLPFFYPDGIKDFNDLAAVQGLDAVRQILQPSSTKFSKRLIQSESLFTAFQSSLNQSFRIKNILPESSGLILIYGAPGAYKSFLALDMALSIATGYDWQGNRVKPCPVMYLAAEGQSGVLKRIEAWKQHRGVEIHGFSLLPMPCLIDSHAELNDLIKIIPSNGMVFLDTLARSMLGDENSTKDMGQVVIAANRIQVETGSPVAIIHHTGKDETKGARGAIALTGATDTAFKVVKLKEFRQVALICDRQKDYDPFKTMIFDMELVDTGYKNVDGEEVTSLVPVYNSDAGGVKEKKKHGDLKGASLTAQKALVKALKDFGIDPPEHIKDEMGMFIAGDKIVTISEWRFLAYRMGISEGDDEKSKIKAFSRAKEILEDKGLIGVLDGFCWLEK